MSSYNALINHSGIDINSTDLYISDLSDVPLRVNSDSQLAEMTIGSNLSYTAGNLNLANNITVVSITASITGPIGVLNKFTCQSLTGNTGYINSVIATNVITQNITGPRGVLDKFVCQSLTGNTGYINTVIATNVITQNITGPRGVLDTFVCQSFTGNTGYINTVIATNVITQNITGANGTFTNVFSTNLTGLLLTAAQTNITSLGTQSGGVNIATGQTYKVNLSSVLSSTTLGTGVLASSLTSLGNLTALNMAGNILATTDNTRSIGSNTLRFNNIYTSGLNGLKVSTAQTLALMNDSTITGNTIDIGTNASTTNNINFKGASTAQMGWFFQESGATVGYNLYNNSTNFNVMNAENFDFITTGYLRLNSSKGVKLPNMSTTTRNAITSPDTGSMIFNTTDSLMNIYNGSAWSSILNSTPVHINYCSCEKAITTTAAWLPRSGSGGSSNSILRFFKATSISEFSIQLGYIPIVSQSWSIYKNEVFQTSFSVAIADWVNPGGGVGVSYKNSFTPISYAIGDRLEVLVSQSAGTMLVCITIDFYGLLTP